MNEASGIDRKKLGMAQLFSEMHPILAPSSDMDPDETVELLCMQTRRTRRKFAARINQGIERLTSDRTVNVEEYLNDDIRELAKYPVGSDGLIRLRPFLQWLQTLHRENTLAIDRARYRVNDAAAHMDRASGDLLRACFENLMWHGVSFVREGDAIVLNLRERLWGKARLVFPAVETPFVGTFPMVGMFFSMDAAYHEGRFSFTFLIDVEFGDEELERRAMQDRNWVRLAFECGCPTMECEYFDYGKILSDFGCRYHRFIEGWCSEVLGKEAMLGDSSLSAREKDLLPLAKILLMSYQLADLESGLEVGQRVEGNLSQKVLELLDNRYGLAPFQALFADNGQEALFELLRQAIEAWGEDDDFEETNRRVWELARELRRLEREDGMRQFYQALTARMLDCSAEFEGVSRIYGSYAEAAEIMRNMIEPKLRAEGFEGTYPHYYRRRGKKGEYISVLTHDMNNRTINGTMTYFFSLSAAVKKLEKQGRGSEAVYFAGEIPFEQSTAEDCAAVFCRGVKYAELGGQADDVKASVSVDVFEGLSEEKSQTDTAPELLRYADVAIGAMKGKAMPRWYRRVRRRSLARPEPETTFNDWLTHYLPWGICLAGLLMVTYIVCGRFMPVTEWVPGLTGTAAVIFSLLAGLVLPLVCAVIKRIKQHRRIWRY